MDETVRNDVEAAVFRRLVSHLRKRTDAQNIDMMITAGFCRNCLGDWYREAAAERGIAMSKDEARALVYGMPQAEWKRLHQKEATPEQQAARDAGPAEDAVPLFSGALAAPDWDAEPAATSIEVFREFAPALGQALVTAVTTFQ